MPPLPAGSATPPPAPESRLAPVEPVGPLVAVALASSTQAPPAQICPLGHTAPAHASTHAPASQRWPDGHATPTQADSLQSPLSSSHARPLGHGVHGQLGLHTPPSQTVPSSQVTLLHGSTQTPTRHTVGKGHCTPSQAARHCPPAHTCPASQTTSAQAGSTQNPAALHSFSGGHTNSPLPHACTHTPRSQT
ncbi:hypothetical protein [Sorangium sp. Soce836]|uniref:hypothetical protein n=1 Tax=Sorangium sp. So ce836 TaxID=2969250 RepID=UPI002350F981|nr:hypothetical protein [Sorangium sp. Soce836]WCQ95322.1 hypothetical protein NQZ70_08098 [Sorangium sp. Soce836]